MYVKNFNFLFNQNFQEKIVQLKKTETHLQELPQKEKQPLTEQTSSRISTIAQPPTINLKRREAQKTKHSIVLKDFFHILVYIFTVYTRVEVKNTHYGWGSCQKSFYNYNNQIAKNKLSSLAACFKNLPSKTLASIFG